MKLTTSLDSYLEDSDALQELSHLEADVLWWGDRELERDPSDLKKPPIRLWYRHIVPDEKLGLPRSAETRSKLPNIIRSLRRKPITDAVEDRYGIPRGLLLAMMAHEWYGDPAQENKPYTTRNKKGNIVHMPYGDGGLWLIHIQASNAWRYWLKTLPRFTEGMRDSQHAKLILEAKKSSKSLEELIAQDDRFHPVMALDVSARFLLDIKRTKWNGTDAWIHALRGYSGRPAHQYAYQVLDYWAAINTFTWDDLQGNFSPNVRARYKKNRTTNAHLKQDIMKYKFTVGDNTNASYKDYLKVFEDRMVNFELDKYMALSWKERKASALPQELASKLVQPSVAKDYEALQTTHQELLTAHETLRESHQLLQKRLEYLEKTHQELINNYADLLGEKTMLVKEYQELKNRYSDLSAKVSELERIWSDQELVRRWTPRTLPQDTPPAPESSFAMSYEDEELSESLLSSSPQFEKIETPSNSKIDVYKYIVQELDNPTKIARDFSTRYSEYEGITHRNVFNEQGDPLTFIYPWDVVYVLAEKK